MDHVHSCMALFRRRGGGLRGVLSPIQATRDCSTVYGTLYRSCPTLRVQVQGAPELGCGSGAKPGGERVLSRAGGMRRKAGGCSLLDRTQLDSLWREKPGGAAAATHFKWRRWRRFLLSVSHSEFQTGSARKRETHAANWSGGESAGMRRYAYESSSSSAEWDGTSVFRISGVPTRRSTAEHQMHYADTVQTRDTCVLQMWATATVLAGGKRRRTRKVWYGTHLGRPCSVHSR